LTCEGIEESKIGKLKKLSEGKEFLLRGDRQVVSLSDKEEINVYLSE
jgi:hypothetical protein